MAFQRLYDVKWQSVNNGAGRLSGRRRDVNQDTYWIGIDVPEGRELIVWADAIKLSENEYDLDVYDAPDGFTGGTVGVFRCLCGNGVDTVQSRVFFGVTPTDTGTHIHKLEDYIDVGQLQGPGRPAAGTIGEGAFQILTVPTLIRLNRQTGGGPYVVSYRAVVWEQDHHAH